MVSTVRIDRAAKVASACLGFQISKRTGADTRRVPDAKTRRGRLGFNADAAGILRQAGTERAWPAYPRFPEVDRMTYLW